MKDVSQILKSLGLVDSEVKTYLQALQHGPSTVMDLSKYTGLSRQASYLAIETLTKRGLMSSVERGKKSFYAAEAPGKLLAYAERQRKELSERVDDLKKVLPELELQTGGEKPVVRVYEGKEGVRAILDDTRMSKPKELYEITDTKALYQTLTTEDLAPYRRELEKNKTKVHGIYDTPGSNQKTEYHKNLVEGGFKSHIAVYGDKISLITFSGKMHSIIIENESLAEAIRKLFKTAFK